MGAAETYKVNGQTVTRFWSDAHTLVGGPIANAKDGQHLKTDFGIAAVINVGDVSQSGLIAGVPFFESLLADDGQPKPASWFTGCIGAAKATIESNMPIYIADATGIDRAPVMAYSVLRARGHSPADALNLVKASAPTFGTTPSHVTYIASAEAAIPVAVKIAQPVKIKK